jgi:GAF domain-containing protein
VTAAGAEALMATRVDDRLAEEQAALRRVATLVARAAAPGEVFAAVAEEVGRVLSADLTILSRYDRENAATVVGAWSNASDAGAAPVGRRFELDGQNVHTVVFRTCRPARVDLAEASGPAAGVFRELGIRSAVGVPITVAGRLWGVMTALSTRAEFLPTDTEARLAGFTELVATAIANGQVRVELRDFAEEQAALRRVATLVAGGRRRRTCSPRSPRRSGGCSRSTSPSSTGTTPTAPRRSSAPGASPAPSPSPSAIGLPSAGET